MTNLERSIKNASIAIFAVVVSGCSTLPSPDKSLVIANCPELAPLSDNTFGATTLKLIEVAGQYHKCRKAALGE